MDGFLELKIVDHAHVQTVRAEWVDVQVPHGNFIIGPGHFPLASLLRKRAVITYKVVDGQVVTCQAAQGTVTVVNDCVTLIFES